MHTFNRPGLFAMPLNQPPRFPFPYIAHNSKMLDLATVTKQFLLPRSNTNRHIAQGLAIFMLRLLPRYKVNLRALPYLAGVRLPISFPTRFRDLQDGLMHCIAHTRTDGKTNEALRPLRSLLVP